MSAQPGNNGNGRPAALGEGHALYAVFNALVDRGWWAWMSSRQVKVIGVFLRRADRNGVSWPSAKSVARDAGLSLRSSNRAIGELSKHGLLVTVRQGGGPGNSTRRRVQVPESLPPVACLPSMTVTEPHKHCSPNVCQPEHGKFATQVAHEGLRKGDVREHRAAGSSEVFPRGGSAKGRRAGAVESEAVEGWPAGSSEETDDGTDWGALVGATSAVDWCGS